MEFLLGLLAGFVIGSSGWWIMALIGLCIIYAYIDDGDGVITVTLLVVGGVTLLAHDANPLTWLHDNAIVVVVGFAVYCTVGMAWAFYKYDRRLKKLQKTDKWQASPTYNKGRITNWLLYWPLSVAHDLTVNLHETLYAAISGRLEAIYRRHFPETGK